MTLEVEAERDAIVGTSVTAWSGWKARLDGFAAEPLSYNHAFLAFRVPVGRHRLELRYRPDSFMAGAAISLATLAVLLFASFRRAESTHLDDHARLNCLRAVTAREGSRGHRGSRRGWDNRAHGA